MKSIIMQKTFRKRKSEELSSEELKAFKSYVKTFRFLTDAMEDLGVNSINIITRAMKEGSAAPETVQKIRAKI
jgi:hypothetical protein